MKYHEAIEKIKQMLDEKGVWHETFEHEAVRTSEEAAKIRPGYSLKQGAKALIVRVKKTGEKFFVMLVLPGDERFSTEKVKRVFGAKDIRFATEDEVLKITGGIKPGGVPPFGNLFGLKVYVDSSLMNNEKIVFNAGDQRFSIAMKAEDYLKLSNAEITKFV
jgi:Cys-tRNA(Pro) deacylase